MTTRNIMRRFRINEISAVDRPAQEGARAVILKRADELPINKEVDPMPEPKLEELQAQLADLTKRAEAAEQALEAEKAARTSAETLSKMNDDERKAMDDMDEEGRKKFLAMSKEEREEFMAARKRADEVVKVDGREVRKSAVGDDVFAILKSQSEAIEKHAADLAKERDAREMADLRKRADDEFGHVPGTSDERATALKAIGSMDEPVRKWFTELLTAHEALVSKAFAPVGVRGTVIPATGTGGEAFLTKVREIAKRDGVPEHAAMSRAREEHPSLFAAFQGE